MMGWKDVFKTKKALREYTVGKPPRFLETSWFGAEYTGDGIYVIVGPCPYTRRTWYAQVTVENGLVKAVK